MRRDVYEWVRTAGLCAVIPVVLAGGPLGGYLIGDLLIKKFGLPGYTDVICVIIGFIAGISETVRIIRIALKIK